ncbi:MAG: hypothetical protein NC936_03175 [Candidatus Omnitrophica bacterium]|nr:hypothetical protein [Candidatus Omnitrophota bacterium]
MKKIFKNYKQTNGQVTMEWVAVIVLVGLALLAIKGYLKGHLQDSWRKQAEQFSQDLYSEGADWTYLTIENSTVSGLPRVSIKN